MKQARILLADDHRLTLRGIRGLLETFYEIVGEMTDGKALVEAALRLRPDLIVLDITMPLVNGIDAATEIRRNLPHVKLLFLTMHVSAGYLAAALNAGATGYVTKSAAAEELLDAVRDVLNGRIYVSPGIRNEQVDRFRDPDRGAAATQLTAREREVLRLIARGQSAKEIGFQLSISVRTVAFHRENIKQKLGLGRTAELTKYAMEKQLI